MTQDQSLNNYSLIFEGPTDESAETLRRLKGVFIADLELSIPEVQKLLESFPTIVRSASSKNELSRALKLIQTAGGKALIVQRAGDNDSEREEELGDEVMFDLDLTAETEELETPKEPPVYSLDFDPDSDSSDLSSLNLEEADSLPLFKTSADSAPRQEAPSTTTTAPLENFLGFELATAEPVDKDEAEQHPTNIPTTPEAEPPYFQVNIAPSDEAEMEAPQTDPELAAPAETTSGSAQVHLELSMDAPDTEPQTAMPAGAPLASTEPLSPPAAPKHSASEEFDLTLQLEEPAPEPTPVNAPATQAAAVPASEPKSQAAANEFALIVEDPEPPSVIAEPATEPAPFSPPEAQHSPDVEAPVMAPPTTPAKETAAIRTHVDPEVEVEIEGEEKLPKAAKRTPRARRLSWSLRVSPEVAGPAIVGLMLLAVVNWLYYGSPVNDSSEKAMKALIERAQSSFDADEKIALGKAVRPPKMDNNKSAPPGQVEMDGVIVKWEVEHQQADPIAFSFTINTAEPPPLTAEEIARQVVRRPWMRKIQTDPFKLPKDLKGELSLTSKARIYIDHGGRTFRRIVEVKFQGRFDREGLAPRGRITLRDGYDALPSDSGARVEYAGPDSYPLFVNLEISPAAPAPSVQAP